MAVREEANEPKIDFLFVKCQYTDPWFKSTLKEIVPWEGTKTLREPTWT